MSIKIEAETLEEAYQKASKKLNCSITDLDIEIVQNPSKGILGFGKKNAIILVNCKKKEQTTKKEVEQKKEIKEEKKSIPKTKVVEKKESKKSIEEPTEKLYEKKNELPKIKDEFENFFKEKQDIETIAIEVEKEINELFSYSCFDIEHINVKPYNENTLLIEFNGKDAALLIGKEGYRYKALSYMLFNWINPIYNLQIRLEIAEFLKTQEESIKNYLKPLIEKIKREGRGQTKPLDGVLIQIALRELRNEFPNMYVAIRTDREGKKYIIVREFNRKNES